MLRKELAWLPYRLLMGALLLAACIVAAQSSANTVSAAQFVSWMSDADPTMTIDLNADVNARRSACINRSVYISGDQPLSTTNVCVYYRDNWQYG